MSQWLSYVRLVVERLGDLCDTYQVMNEPNNPLYSFFPADRQGAAISAAAEIIRARVPGARIVVNVLMDWGGWRDAVSRYLLSAGPAIDVIGIDHYPGTWTFSDESDWDGFITLAHEAANPSPDSMWRHTRLALIETGFATNGVWLRGDMDQAAYFETVANTIRQVDGLQPQGLLSHIGIYELVDKDSGAILDPEAHFGLLTSRFTRKSSFATVAALFDTFAAL